jgi:hypothetical protein
VIAEADTAAGYILVPIFDAISELGNRIFDAGDAEEDPPSSTSGPSLSP